MRRAFNPRTSHSMMLRFNFLQYQPWEATRGMIMAYKDSDHGCVQD